MQQQVGQPILAIHSGNLHSIALLCAFLAGPWVGRDAVQYQIAGSLMAIGVVLWAWWRKFLNLTLLDLAAPALAAGYAVGRIGCQLSGDGDYGKPYDGFLAMGYPDGTVPTPPGVTVWPTPIFETIIMFAVAAVLWKFRERFRLGILFAIYLICAGLERFFIEFLRTNVDVALGLTAAQLESLGMVIAGVVWMVVVKQRYGTLARPEDSPAR